jgi:hypothetical protein
MTHATSTCATRPDDDDGVHATDVRDAAAKHESEAHAPHRLRERRSSSERTDAPVLHCEAPVRIRRDHDDGAKDRESPAHVHPRDPKRLQGIHRHAPPPELATTRPSAAAAWVWNIRSNPNVRLRIRGGTFAGVTRERDRILGTHTLSSGGSV